MSAVVTPGPQVKDLGSMFLKDLNSLLAALVYKHGIQVNDQLVLHVPTNVVLHPKEEEVTIHIESVNGEDRASFSIPALTYEPRVSA